eukprot:CAMPEP_0196661604 /NCGR_PEP_ID=MMETSP1086-20130531/45124_1 /TAXON_ID=77921 /ORGANISM="Cyanoptyche  gloeocystis , Strain SAG4.97" /LENGTH=223 /DNA_ID=CAMNT_0041996587 /DNA_START=16 /DNA_END=687 /DNA_ORIENTATION=-
MAAWIFAAAAVHTRSSSTLTPSRVVCQICAPHQQKFQKPCLQASRQSRFFSSSSRILVSSVNFEQPLRFYSSADGESAKSPREELKKMSIEALKKKDMQTRQQLSSVLSKFTEEEKTKGFSGWTVEKEVQIVTKYVQSLEQGLAELGEKQESALGQSYKSELELLKQYLPKMLSKEEIRALVEPLVKQAKGLGPFMGLVMKNFKGKGVDPAVAKEIGQELGLK